jgi:hypothetical protein
MKQAWVGIKITWKMAMTGIDPEMPIHQKVNIYIARCVMFLFACFVGLILAVGFVAVVSLLKSMGL